MWKSQSPWPSLRGNLYDSYLANNGGYYGVKQATHSNIEIPSPSSSSPSSSASLSSSSSSLSSSSLSSVYDVWEEWFYDLHVQFNPLKATCGVMNRGLMDFDLLSLNASLQVI